MENQKPEALILASDRPSAIGGDLYQWALDAEDMIRRLHARVEELEKDRGNAKRLVSKIWNQHPEARDTVEKATGAWLVFGQDVETDGVSAQRVTQAKDHIAQPIEMVAAPAELNRELLELAAHAAGIPTIPCTCSDTRWPFKHDEEKSGKRGHWNPLENDGDALRLAVKLKIRIGFRPAAYADTPTGIRFYGAHNGDNADSRTRFAIVRAAAEIGGTLQAAKATGGADSGQGSQKGTP